MLFYFYFGIIIEKNIHLCSINCFVCGMLDFCEENNEVNLIRWYRKEQRIREKTISLKLMVC